MSNRDADKIAKVCYGLAKYTAVIGIAGVSAGGLYFYLSQDMNDIALAHKTVGYGIDALALSTGLGLGALLFDKIKNSLDLENRVDKNDKGGEL